MRAFCLPIRQRRFYNQNMRFNLFIYLSLMACSLTWAQSTTPNGPALAPAAPSTKGQAADQRTQHIRIEDAGARIDELRVGGETKSIQVQPKGGMPAYQLAPNSGERSWKVLGF
jgi:hypothetical protein